MERIEKTVFISYRRTNIPWALAVFQNLTHHGFDVFFDYKGIASGDFDREIIGNIRSRAHFVVLLTPSALERCGEPTDWLRREIETAIDSERNIVPLMLEAFDFGNPRIAGQLTGKLGALRNYNGVSVPPDYFEEAMERLRSRFLNVPLKAVLHPAAAPAQRAASEQKAAAELAPAVQEEELTAQEWFERGYAATDHDEEARLFGEAIRLKPDYSEAFYNRGLARFNKKDYAGALADFDEALRLAPGDIQTLISRGATRYNNGDVDGALRDSEEVIARERSHPEAFYNRGLARKAHGDLTGALKDYDEAIRLDPNDPDYFAHRALAKRAVGDLEGAALDNAEDARLSGVRR